MEQKSSFVIVIMLIIGMVAGFAAGVWVTQSRATAQVQKLQTQIDQAKKFFPPLPQEMKSVSGTVKDVNADEHIVMMETSMASPFDESPVMRKVTISPDTKITRAEAKDQATFQREIADFQKAVRAQSGASGSHSLTPPEPFREVSATVADIRPGARITVTADENIRDKESFTAAAIRIMDLSASGNPFGIHAP